MVLFKEMKPNPPRRESSPELSSRNKSNLINDGSFQRPAHDTMDSSCIGGYEERSVLHINKGITRTTTLSERQATPPRIGPILNSPKFGTPSNVRMTPVPVSAKSSHYQKRLSMIGTLDTGSLSAAMRPGHRRSMTPTTPRVRDEDDSPSSPRHLLQEEGRSSLRFTRLLMEALESKH